MLANDEDPLGNTVRMCATATLRLGLVQVLLGAAGLVFEAINELNLIDKTAFGDFDGSEYILASGSLVRLFTDQPLGRNICLFQVVAPGEG